MRAWTMNMNTSQKLPVWSTQCDMQLQMSVVNRWNMVEHQDLKNRRILRSLVVECRRAYFRLCEQSGVSTSSIGLHLIKHSPRGPSWPIKEALTVSQSRLSHSYRMGDDGRGRTHATMKINEVLQGLEVAVPSKQWNASTAGLHRAPLLQEKMKPFILQS